LLAIELMEQIRAMFPTEDRSKIPAFEQWQQQILQARRLL